LVSGYRPWSQKPSWLAVLQSCLILLVAGGGLLFVMVASYPGYLNPDSIDSIRQAEHWIFNDWHSPFVPIVWSGLHWLIRDLGVVIGFNNLLIWGGATGLALALRKEIGFASILVAGLPWLPGLFNLLGNVVVDVLLCAWLMAAMGVAYVAGSDTLRPRGRAGLTLLANVLLFCAFMSRLSAIFCLVPLLLYINRGLGLKRNLLLSAVLLLAMPFSYRAMNTAIGTELRAPADSLKAYDLMALSHHEHANLLPGVWTEQQASAVVNACYSPIQWDSAWSGRCRFVQEELNRQGYWGAWALSQAWLGAVTRHPLAYFQLRAATFQRAMMNPNSRNMLYNASPNPWNWEVATMPQRTSTGYAQAYIRSNSNDSLSRPWIFIAISALALVLLFRSRAVDSRAGRLALALVLSGLIYLLSYFPLAVSVEYRYFYWTGFASYLGLILAAALAWRSRSARTAPVGGRDGDLAVRRVALALAALAAALAVFPLRMPTVNRAVHVTPLDDKPVHVYSIRNSATPKWMTRRFDGPVEAGEWVSKDDGYRSLKADAPLATTVDMLAEDLLVVLETGPGRGQVLIEDENGYRRQVDTAADSVARVELTLPAPAYHEPWWLDSYNVAAAALYFAGFLWLLLRVASPLPGSSCGAVAGAPAGRVVDRQ
jgi:hypothetical protein